MQSVKMSSKVWRQKLSRRGTRTRSLTTLTSRDAREYRLIPELIRYRWKNFWRMMSKLSMLLQTTPFTTSLRLGEIVRSRTKFSSNFRKICSKEKMTISSSDPSFRASRGFSSTSKINQVRRTRVCSESKGLGTSSSARRLRRENKELKKLLESTIQD